MPKSLFHSVLVGLLFLCGIATCILALVYVRSVGEMRKLQSQVNVITTQQNVVRTLVAETVEYSKKNPAIDPLLQSVGAKTKTAK
jgi:hypothetical protein